ncbi:hypothetical protein Tco_0315846 [Tanacetum coccineum]
MTTLAEFMIVAGAENRPPMLEKQCRTHGRVVCCSTSNERKTAEGCLNLLRIDLSSIQLLKKTFKFEKRNMLNSLNKKSFKMTDVSLCRHRYAVSSLMDTAYWMSEQYSSDFFV